ncbi:MAG: hypothetical protein QXN14_00860 [Ignisphaera sp.]
MITIDKNCTKLLSNLLSYLAFRSEILVLPKGHIRYTPSAVSISRNRWDAPTIYAKSKRSRNSCNDIFAPIVRKTIAIDATKSRESIKTPIGECVYGVLLIPLCPARLSISQFKAIAKNSDIDIA